ncbi:MAG: chorismate synthase, partial [Clostridia bacterium]|nr:chorismate synthase [Clostridia bacterium]
MTSGYGNKIRITISGESHGPCIEAVLSGIPAGEPIDMNEIALQMSRRAPGKDNTSTPRKESDLPQFVSGITDGVTTGEDIHIVIENTNTHSSDYDNLKFTPRPSHADYPAYVKYNGEADMRGSGHFSGRLTAPLTAAGAVCKQILKKRGITVGGHVYNIGDVFDIAFNGVMINEDTLNELSSKYFATLSPDAEKEMREYILDAANDGDSIGGSVEIAVTGMPVGIGNHMFGG